MPIVSKGLTASLFLLLAAGRILSQRPGQLSVTPVVEADAACSQCHQSIYARYLKTPMANASGLAVDKVLEGRFLNARSDTAYQVSFEGQSLWLSYQDKDEPAFHVRKQLDYFLGSGHLGLTYMYSVNGYLLESPVAYYSSIRGYEMKPGIEGSSSRPSALPMSSGCMRCHMSGVQREDPGSINHYQGLPFLHGGITCESCHGDARAHSTSEGRIPVVNPSKLDAKRRDSVCIICHLEGDASVEHRGYSGANFKPGDQVEDYLSYFVYRDARVSDRGVSEIEQLNLSLCKRTSGDRMSCMSCHDPHDRPSPEARTAFYRRKCLSCHAQKEMGAEHHPENPDCTSCHMPSGKADNIPHVAWTDHRIRREPAKAEPQVANPDKLELIPILGQTATARDLGLAYFNLVAGGKTSEKQRAWQILLSSAALDDPAVLTALGYLAEIMGNSSQAVAYDRAALNLDPLNISAGNNLASLLAQSGDLKGAVQLWQNLFSRNEDIEALGVNLAIAKCKLGDRNEAKQALNRVLLYSPDSEGALGHLRSIKNGTEKCFGQ